ncbi:MAG: hypothetical protein Q7R81_07470 [Candidatus Peregrinibacteria bacterium]|nr:hypothetical protein [Candidatus Peregrinibacteria bacterium]
MVDTPAGESEEHGKGLYFLMQQRIATLRFGDAAQCAEALAVYYPSVHALAQEKFAKAQELERALAAPELDVDQLRDCVNAMILEGVLQEQLENAVQRSVLEKGVKQHAQQSSEIQQLTPQKEFEVWMGHVRQPCGGPEGSLDFFQMYVREMEKFLERLPAAVAEGRCTQAEADALLARWEREAPQYIRTYVNFREAQIASLPADPLAGDVENWRADKSAHISELKSRYNLP